MKKNIQIHDYDNVKLIGFLDSNIVISYKLKVWLWTDMGERQNTKGMYVHS